jgi:AraC-like DNA-binding protein
MRVLLVQFPKKLLPLPDRHVARLLAVPLSSKEGIGRLLSQFLTGMAEEHADCTPRDRARLASTTIDLVAATLAHHLDREAAMPLESRQRILFHRITSFIQEYLADPGLGPASIASAHQISLRYLHRIFQQQNTTVSALIRQMRLDRCRRDLADPGRRDQTIRAIGARWGFTSPADFSRAFRAGVGMPPVSTAPCSARLATWRCLGTNGREMELLSDDGTLPTTTPRAGPATCK